MRLGRRRKPTLTTTASSADGSPLIEVPSEVLREAVYLSARLDLQDETPTSIAMTSFLSGEGVSTVSRALASVLSETRRVCLIEANWKSPTLAIGYPGGGLLAVLSGAATLDEAIVATDSPTLSLIPAGTVSTDEPPASVDLVDPDVITRLLEALALNFDMVILDLAAITASASTLAMADAAQAAILVVRQGVTNIDQVDTAVGELRHSRFLGVVINASKIATPKFVRRRQKTAAT